MRVLPRVLCMVACGSAAVANAAETRTWDEIVAQARGQTVFWNAWTGDECTNAFIAWVGEEVAKRYGVSLEHVKLKDTAEAVTRVVAEKAAGRNEGGSTLGLLAPGAAA